MSRIYCWLVAASLLGCNSLVGAEDFFLTIGGGYSPSGNQASLENNVMFVQRALGEQGVLGEHNDIYFSDGDAVGKDLQVMDPNSVPKANRLMAEFFGSGESLGLSYRNHRVPNVKGSTEPDNIRNWFGSVGQTMKSGDRLYIYVTAHGSRSSDRQSPYDTTIATWNNTKIRMTELVKMLDGLPDGVDVIAIMVQCHAGGFARYIFNEGDPEKGLSQQNRIGFFATGHDRPASGCTPEVDEASYVEYSTYFWAALSGRNRSGRLIERPDYDGNGVVSFDEAHAYTVITADTIDLPVLSSGEFLSIHSYFDEDDPRLLRNDESYALILNLATPSQRAILEGLSEQLSLSGDRRINEAWKTTQSDQGRNSSRRRRRSSPEDSLRRRITRDLERKWPELANVLNPIPIELVTRRSDEFVEAVENHPDYLRYRELIAKPETDRAKTKVKFERLVRIADNVALAENLRRLGDEKLIAQFNAIMAAENRSLKQHAAD